jgi:hypothetical protein
LPTLPDVDLDDVEEMTGLVEVHTSQFSKDLFNTISQPLRQITYGFDEFGNR